MPFEGEWSNRVGEEQTGDSSASSDSSGDEDHEYRLRQIIALSAIASVAGSRRLPMHDPEMSACRRVAWFLGPTANPGAIYNSFIS